MMSLLAKDIPLNLERQKGQIVATLSRDFEDYESEDIVNKLLSYIEAHSLYALIINLRFVTTADTLTVKTILNMVKSSQLMGVEVTIAGVRASIACYLSTTLQELPNVCFVSRI